MKTAFKKLKQSPVFTGFILFTIVLIINILIQNTGGFLPQKYSSVVCKNTPLILVTMAQALMLMGIIDISIGIQMSLANVIAIMLPLKYE